MKLITLMLLCLMGIVTVGCHEDDPEPQPKKSRRTVIVYMAAENSLACYKEGDLREMLNAKDSIPLDCNLVVYVDDTHMPSIYTYSAMTGEELWKTLPEQDSCDSLVFRNTLADIVTNFAAEHYGLVMWSHGSGWIPAPKRGARENGPHKTIGIDNNFNSLSNTGSELDIPVMRRMLEQLGVHWDYIFFDACFMQCIEVDYELRKLCDYVIASPAEIPGDGAPYHLIMSSLFKDKNAVEDICRIYFKENEGKEMSGVKTGLIISASRSSEMENMALTMKGYITTLFANKRQFDAKDVQVYCHYVYNSVWKPEYYDLGSAMNLLLSSPADYQALKAQLDKAYPVNLHSQFWVSEFYNHYQGYVTDAEHLASVSMFIPHEKYDMVDYNAHLHSFQWYHAAGWDQTGW